MVGSPFRDELASAHGTIERLRRENHDLRQQLDRLPVRTRPSLLVPLTTAWAILMTASLVRVTAREVPPAIAAPAVMRIPPVPVPARALSCPSSAAVNAPLTIPIREMGL